MRIIWLFRAVQDLRAVRAYIEQHNPEAARKTAGVITAAVLSLAEMPAAGRPGRVSGTRELVIPGTRYIVIYRVRDNALEILRVMHGARRWPELPDNGPE